MRERVRSKPVVTAGSVFLIQPLTAGHQLDEQPDSGRCSSALGRLSVARISVARIDAVCAAAYLPLTAARDHSESRPTAGLRTSSMQVIAKIRS
jgi:hypothetical protein